MSSFWYLKVMYDSLGRSLRISLLPECTPYQGHPMGRVIFRVSAPATGRPLHVSPVCEKMICSKEDHNWIIYGAFHGCLIIVVEFLDFKRPSSRDSPAWACLWTPGNVSTAMGQRCLSQMLQEGIHADVTINTSDGSLKAHKAVLASCSPVFDRMFAHDLKENESSVIELNDASKESISAFLSFVYGTIKWKVFWPCRMPLLKFAHKYDIPTLKDCCELALLEDLDSGNVFERLHEASVYQLDKLKKGCLTYLFEFWKIDELSNEMSVFFRNADRDLLFEIFQSLVPVQKWV